MLQNKEVVEISRIANKFRSIVASPEPNLPGKGQSDSLYFVDPSRISELENIHSKDFDLTKLIEYCKELNKASFENSFLAIPMLGRAILDHIPPIFGCKSFAEVANNYSSGTKSFKQSMGHLENSTRKIADSYLHVQIRSNETLPNRIQINFSADLDVLLAEIVRILKKRTV